MQNQRVSRGSARLEKLRQNYKPSKTLVLLVGESPPPHMGFFYDPGSPEGQLSRNTRRVFEKITGAEFADRREFLNHFKKNGCYLLDLFPQRGKTIHKTNRREEKASIEKLSEFIQDEKPKTVVAVLKRISKPVEEAVQRARTSASYKALPYPTRQYVRQYSSGLGAILSELWDTTLSRRARRERPSDCKPRLNLHQSSSC